VNRLGCELFPEAWTGEEHEARRGLISEEEWLKIKDLAPARGGGGGAPGSGPTPKTVATPVATAPHRTGDNRKFQRMVTEYCWGEVWSEETLLPRERSILTLGMVAALGKMGEFANHVLRGAGANGLTPDELRAVLIQIAIYCGIPVGADCFRVAESVLSESKRT
jgi:4-carboxymuconolactone decarboxylase